MQSANAYLGDFKLFQCQTIKETKKCEKDLQFLDITHKNITSSFRELIHEKEAWASISITVFLFQNGKTDQDRPSLARNGVPRAFCTAAASVSAAVYFFFFVKIVKVLTDFVAQWRQ